MTRTLATTIAACAVLTGLSSVALAQGKKGPAAAAAVELKKAKAHFDLQEYDLAEQALKEAYRLDPKPETLYALAQAQRMAGACDRAIVSYKNYLRSKPREDLAQAATENITRCEGQIAEAQKPIEPVKPVEPSPPVEPVKPEPPSVVSAPVTHDEPTGVPWTRNWAGHALLAGGLLLAAGGTFLAFDANGTIETVNDSSTYGLWELDQTRLDDAKSQRTLGYVLTGAGAAMAAGAIIVYLVRSPDEKPSRTARIGIDPRGAVQIAWGF